MTKSEEKMSESGEKPNLEVRMGDDRRTQQVSLGCGTLILIALIVLFISSRANRDLERDIKVLRTEIGELKTLIESQSAHIKSLREKSLPNASSQETLENP